jgi:CRISPR/Cas system CMR subunit Cmr6 (Cas7 group RAMP superfamily)
MEYYKVELEVITRIHIGSGEKIKKYEYVYDDGDFVRIINLSKLIELMTKENMFDDFLGFIQQATRNVNNREASLYEYLNSRKNLQGRVLSDKEVLDSITDYKVYIKKNLSRFQDIRLFMKDSMKKPYVPGSSVKGMIINAISAVMPEKDIKAVSSAIILSDSLPIDTANLIIDTVKRYNIKKGKESAVNEYIEFLKPQTKIRMTLKLDTNVITIDQIEYALQTFYQIYQKYYRNYFAGAVTPLPARKNCMFLGAYTGFSTKTVVYPKYREHACQRAAQILSRQFRKPERFFMFRNVAPLCLKCVSINGKLYENGAVSIEFVRKEGINEA